jgi:hypothetical protein
MSQCRMCSQRLTRPGRLCRECERELERARAVAQSVGNLSSAAPLVDNARMAADSIGWAARMTARPGVIAVAFSIGIAAAAALYVVQGSHAAGASESVMIDRDLSKIRPRERRGAAPPLAVSAPANAAADGVASRKALHSASRREPIVVGMAATGSRPEPGSTNMGRTATATRVERPSPPIAHDRVLGLAAALDACSSESLFARIACEQRAKTRYCEGAEGRIPQCAEPPPREYGQ